MLKETMELNLKFILDDLQNQDFENLFNSFLEIKSFKNEQDGNYIFKITITLGGPNIFLFIDEDFGISYLQGYWGNEKEKINIDYSELEFLIDYLK